MRIALLLLLLSSLYFLPGVTEAAQLVPVECAHPDQCGTCELVQLTNNVIQWIITIASIVVVGVFMYAGVLLVVSGGNVEMRKKAQGYFTNVVIGYVLILGGFLIVDVFLKTLQPSDSPVLDWRSVECLYPTEAVFVPTDFGDGDDELIGGADDDLFGASAGGGQCKAYASGPCGEAALQAAGFGGIASDAARIIGAESSCNPTAQSGTDTTTNKRPDGRPYSYSIGIWQINLAVHSLSCGGKSLNCPAAFTNPGTRNKYNIPERTIVDFNLYNRCVVAASNPACNHAKAAELATRSGDMGDWACSAKKCGIHTSRNGSCKLKI